MFTCWCSLENNVTFGASWEYGFRHQYLFCMCQPTAQTQPLVPLMSSVPPLMSNVHFPARKCMCGAWWTHVCAHLNDWSGQMEHPVVVEGDETVGTPSAVASASTDSSVQVSSRKQQMALAGNGTSGDLFTPSAPSDSDLLTAEFLPKIET